MAQMSSVTEWTRIGGRLGVKRVDLKRYVKEWIEKGGKFDRSGLE